MDNKEFKTSLKKNNKKGYATKNVKIVNDKYFSVNSSMLSSFNDNLNISFWQSGGKKTYLNTKEILSILQGSNTYQKQQTINDLSDFFYSINGVYSTLIDKMASIPSFDRVIARGSKAKLKKHYIKVLRTISEKFVAKDCLKSFLKSGVYFGYLSYLEKNDNANGTETYGDDDLQIVAFSDISIIPLSPKYTRILTTDGKTYRIGIDVSQLNEVDLRGFPNEIYKAVVDKRKAYNESLKNKKNTNVFAQQYFILDEKRTIVLKNKSTVSESTGRGQFVTAIVELIHDMNVGNKKASMLPKVGKDLIYETYPEGSKGKGTSSLTQTQMDKQHDFIADALNDLTSFTDTSMVSIHPGTKLDKLTLSEGLNNITSDDILKRMGTHSGVSMGFLNGENLKSDKTLLYLYEVMASELDDFMVQFQKELNKVVRYTINNKSDIDFPYIYYLPTNRLNRDTYMDKYHKMFVDAGASYQLYLASSGVDPEIHLDLMDEEEELNFREKYPAHPMGSTSSWVNEGKEKTINENIKEEKVEVLEKEGEEKNE